MSGVAGWGRGAAPSRQQGAVGARWRGDRLFVFCLSPMPFPQHVRPHLLCSHAAQLQEGGHGDQQQGDAKDAVRHAHRQRRRRSWAAHGPEVRRRRRRRGELAQHCRSPIGWRFGLEVTRGRHAGTSGGRGAGGGKQRDRLLRARSCAASIGPQKSCMGVAQRLAGSDGEQSCCASASAWPSGPLRPPQPTGRLGRYQRGLRYGFSALSGRTHGGLEEQSAGHFMHAQAERPRPLLRSQGRAEFGEQRRSPRGGCCGHDCRGGASTGRRCRLSLVGPRPCPAAHPAWICIHSLGVTSGEASAGANVLHMAMVGAEAVMCPLKKDMGNFGHQQRGPP